MGGKTVLLVMILAVPLAGAAVLLLLRKGDKNIISVASAAVLALTLFLLKNVFGGGPVELAIHLHGPYAPVLRADPISALFVVLAAFIWFAVSIYMPGYMEHEARPRSFGVWTLLTLTVVEGVFLAGDPVTMLLFFELMAVTSYFWVIHRGYKKAVRSGNLYLFFSIAAGFLLTLGIVLIFVATGKLPEVGSVPATPSDPHMFGWGIALLVLGFGIKAGAVPLHIWLPHAHSAAPTPGSALLSGLLIKVGAYGLIRTAELAGCVREAGNGVTWLGPVLIAAGICSMLGGVAAALLQSDAKRLLAYHSISQMGYIIFGLGIDFYLESARDIAFTGAVFHIINHALFKAALFLGVGIIYIRTKETNLYRLGGLWRRFPVTAVLMLLAVLGITGAPGLNGYAGKTLLHHAAGMAAGTGSPWLVWAERLFVLTGVGTAASFAKLYYLTFLGKPSDDTLIRNPGDDRVSGRMQPGMNAAMALLAVVMVGIGIAPEFFVNTAVIPAVGASDVDKAVADLTYLAFWSTGDVIGMVITLLIGVLVCWVGLRYGIFHRKFPVWLTPEGLVKLAVQGISRLWRAGTGKYTVLAENAHESGSAVKARLYSAIRKFDRSRSSTIGGLRLTGISADAAILFMILAILILWYTIIDPGLHDNWLPFIRPQ